MISIIVPVYNAERWLKRCIDSILCQTYSNFELLLIDDGSKDNSLAICEKCSEEDNRIRVLHKSNGGVSSARNFGMDRLKGEFITFVDSDDYIEPTYLSGLLECMTDDIDLVISYTKHLYVSGRCRIEDYPKAIISKANYNELFVKYKMHWHTAPWGKLYRSSNCDNLRFNEKMHIGEDALFLYSYMLQCNKIFVSNATDYVYVVDNVASLTKRINSFDSEMTSYCNILTIVDKMICDMSITSAEALNNLEWLRCSYLRRVLTSLYYDSSLTRENRIKELSKLDFTNYCCHQKSVSVKEKILKWLLNNKQYLIYDIIRSVTVRVKKWNTLR